MPAPAFASKLLGWRGRVPNTADSHSKASREIAGAMLELLGNPGATAEAAAEYRSAPEPPKDPGGGLESEVRDYLTVELNRLAPDRSWNVRRGGIVSAFSQYEHLARIQNMIDNDDTGTLATEIGRDYLIAPDVTVAITIEGSLPILHAAVSCKWTIRSDRVQNIRHEAVILNRHRRGRQPHIVAVTAEPLPTRLASIARGTGEIDALYHVAFHELAQATQAVGTSQQKATLDELVTQKRLADIAELPSVLAI